MRNLVLWLLLGAWTLAAAQGQQHQENIQVVRVSETLYVPWTHPTQPVSSSSSNNHDHKGHARQHLPQGSANESKHVISATAHYSTTIKPILRYLVQHPVRALRRYIIPYAFHASVQLVFFIGRATRAVVRFSFFNIAVPVVRPARSIFSTFVVRPFESLVDAVLSWKVVWTFLGFALVSGSCMGAVAGWLTRSDKPSKDQWVDLVNANTSVKARESLYEATKKRAPYTANDDADGSDRSSSLVVSSSSKNSRAKQSAHAKGKSRATSDSDTEAGTTTVEDDENTRPSMMGNSGRMLSHLKFGESDTEADY